MQTTCGPPDCQEPGIKPANSFWLQISPEVSCRHQGLFVQKIPFVLCTLDKTEVKMQKESSISCVLCCDKECWGQSTGSQPGLPGPPVRPELLCTLDSHQGPAILHHMPIIPSSCQKFIESIKVFYFMFQMSFYFVNDFKMPKCLYSTKLLYCYSFHNVGS